jgi:hypothetical protein
MSKSSKYISKCKINKYDEKKKLNKNNKTSINHYIISII